MIDQTTLITYLAVLLGFVFIPGPAVVLTMARATSSGTKAGIATGVGIAIGDLLHTAMAVLGSGFPATFRASWCGAVMSRAGHALD